MSKLSLLSTDDAIRGEIVLPIPPSRTDADDAAIPRIVAATIEECSKLPEVAKHRQATEKAKTIECRLRECNDRLAELFSKQAELRNEQSVDEMLAAAAALRAKQAESEELQAVLDQFNSVLRTLAAQAHDAALNNSQDTLARYRCNLAGEANRAQARAAALLPPLIVQIEAVTKSPKALAAIKAHAEAERVRAASRLLNSATSEVVHEILSGLDLVTGNQ